MLPSNCLWHSPLPIEEGICGHMWSKLCYMVQKHCGTGNQWGMKLCHVYRHIPSFSPQNWEVCCIFVRFSAQTVSYVKTYWDICTVWNHCKLFIRHSNCCPSPHHLMSVSAIYKQIGHHSRGREQWDGDNMSHLCLWALEYDSQHDSSSPYRPATLTLPFSTFWPTERASLFSHVLVTSTQDHASISNRLPNN